MDRKSKSKSTRIVEWRGETKKRTGKVREREKE
jgi:hypothetical protein